MASILDATEETTVNGPGDKLSIKEKLAYGLGGAGSSILLMPFTMHLFSFYTDAAGLAPATAGTIFLIARVWRLFIDPLMGVISDRTETPWGKFRPYLLFSALGYGVFGVRRSPLQISRRRQNSFTWP
jgi:GPH family glycoside/pentoside/hexuronide:cation symporter